MQMTGLMAYGTGIEFPCLNFETWEWSRENCLIIRGKSQNSLYASDGMS
jgi:hypothetical protein